MNANISKALRNIVAERDSYTCILCTNHYSDIHHYIPRGRGGRNNPHNLVCLCRPCHMQLHGELPRPNGATREDYDQLILEYLADYYAEDIEAGIFEPD